jgi:homoserine/homoserine lactone efflux protein
MMAFNTALLFTGTALIFSFLPGPAVMQVSAQAFRGGFGTAVTAILGILAGNMIYFVITVLGFGALLITSATAFYILRIIGAAYLIGLGAYTIWRARDVHAAANSSGRPFRQALLTQLSNPKAILFLGAFLPQFLDPHKALAPQYAEMLLIIVPVEGLILGGYGFLAAHGARLMGGAASILWRDRISGAVFIAIGVLFAAARRA